MSFSKIYSFHFPSNLLFLEIVVTWAFIGFNLSDFATIHTYQVFSYRDLPGSNPDPKLVGEFEARPLPMGCFYRNFPGSGSYHFFVRAQDVHGRIGPSSDTQTITLE